MASLTHEDVREIAEQNDLGPVMFEHRVAQNTGRAFEVGMIGERILFAKKHSHTDFFHLCNEYRALVSNDGHGPLD